MADDDNKNDDNKKPSLDPLEGMGKRAKKATDEFIAEQYAKVEEQKNS